MMNTNSSNTSPELSSRLIDEDALLDCLQLRIDSILAPNASLFKFYEMASKLDGDLLLIMYLLNNTLDAIFEKLKYKE